MMALRIAAAAAMVATVVRRVWQLPLRHVFLRARLASSPLRTGSPICLHPLSLSRNGTVLSH
jgi:hypothetical protein